MLDDRKSATHATMPLVSACIPTYNRSAKLMRAINSLYASDYRNIEIIISDNASSDNTERLCAELSDDDKRIRYFRQSENVGPTKNFEFARAQAGGKYFMWLADDDWIDPTYISLCVQALEDDPSVALAAGQGAYHRDDGSFAYHGNVIEAGSSLPILRVMKYLWRVWDNSMFYGVYRRSMVEKCRIPNILAGDWAWVADVLLRGKAAVVPGVFIHREFEDSTASTIRRMVSALGLPAWHGKFPWIAIGASIASHMAKAASGGNALKNVCVYVAVFITVFFRRNNIRLVASHVPFFTRIYRFVVARNDGDRNYRRG
ncbi:MAG: glycosyltransferase family 2 protein [Porticoccaceae bacterium]